MNFARALNGLYAACKMRRTGWNGKGMWIKLQYPTDKSKMTLPYIYMKTATGEKVPWVASQTDILADDWVDACDDK